MAQYIIEEIYVGTKYHMMSSLVANYMRNAHSELYLNLFYEATKEVVRRTRDNLFISG